MAGAPEARPLFESPPRKKRKLENTQITAAYDAKVRSNSPSFFFRPTIPSNVIEFQSSECTNRQISSSYERTPRNIFIDSAETKQGPPLIGVSTQLSETTFSAYS